MRVLFFKDKTLYTHCGWIPCITGHLDFGLMAPNISGSFSSKKEKDSKVTNVNFGYIDQQNHHARRIMMQSFADWLDNPAEGRDGSFRIFLLAEATENKDLDLRALNGKLFIYPKCYEERYNKKNGTSNYDWDWFKYIHDASKALSIYKSECIKSKYENYSPQWSEFRNTLNGLYNDLFESLNNNKYIPEHFYEVAFSISPRGFIRLKLESSTNFSKETYYTIVRQSFYYIKYSLHQHKHHHTEEDALTTIIPMDHGAIRHEQGLKMIGQLKRELVTIKRTYAEGGSAVYDDEQGIIAYIGSLITSLRHEEIISNAIFEREKEYISSISDSFKAQSTRRNKNDSEELKIRSEYRFHITLFVSSMALTVSLLSLFGNYILKYYVSFGKLEESQKFFLTWDLKKLSIIIIACGTAISLAYYRAIERNITRRILSKSFKWVKHSVEMNTWEYIKKELATRFLETIVAFKVIEFILLIYQYTN